MRILISILALAFSLPILADTNGVVNLEFTQPQDTTNVVAHYFIAYGRNPRGTNNSVLFYQNHKLVPKVAGPTNNAWISNLTYGAHFFSAYAVITNSFGTNTSNLSNEIGWTNGSFGPMQLRIKDSAESARIELESSSDGIAWRTLAIIDADYSP